MVRGSRLISTVAFGLGLHAQGLYLGADRTDLLEPDSSAVLAANATVNSSAVSFPVSRDGVAEVTLYYETMCPYCHQFFIKMLQPLYNDPVFRPHLNFKAYPAGNVQVIDASMVSKGFFFWHEEKVKDKYVFLCQHGESECLGNMIHSCAQRLLDPDMTMKLMFCMAEQSQATPERSSYQCMTELGIAPEPIRECVHTPETNTAMFEIAQADKGLSPPRKYVPWVLVNGVHADLENDGDFKKILCEVLGDAAPEPCHAQQLAAAAPNLMVLREAPDHSKAEKQRCYAPGFEPKA